MTAGVWFWLIAGALALLPLLIDQIGRLIVVATIALLRRRARVHPELAEDVALRIEALNKLEAAMDRKYDTERGSE